MRRPGLWTVIGLLLVATGISAATWGIGVTHRLQIWDDPYRAAQAFTAISMGLTLCGLVLAGLSYLVYRKRAALMAGEGVLARWRVGMADWAVFRRRDAARNGLFHSLRNRLRLPADLPPEGVDIRVGPNAMLIGDACYGLGVGFMPAGGALIDVGWVEGPPGMLEFTAYKYQKGGSKLTSARIPVPEGARAEAQKLLDHFQHSLDARRRERIRESFALHFQAAEGDAGEAEAARVEDRSQNWRAWGFSFLVVGGIILAIILTKDVGPNADLNAVRMLTIGGAVLAAAGLIALIVSVLSRR